MVDYREKGKNMLIPNQSDFDTLQNHIENSLLSLWAQGRTPTLPSVQYLYYSIMKQQKGVWVVYLQDIPNSHGDLIRHIAQDLVKQGYAWGTVEFFRFIPDPVYSPLSYEAQS